MSMAVHAGRCLCGGVQYELRGPLRGITACHCNQCRQTSGHHVAMTSISSAALTLTASHGLRWYRSSATAERGFCATCGGNLFWRQLDGDTTGVAAGTLDSPTGLKIDKHIFVASKGDYYSIDDAAPQFPESDQPAGTRRNA